MKIVKYLFISIGILLLILLAAPFVLKKPIVRALQQQMNRQLNATIHFDPDIGLNFFRHFPNADLRIDSLTIINHAPFEGDTLLCIDRLHAVVDLSSLWKGNTYQIRMVELDRPYIQLLVNEQGKANWDITQPSSSSEKSTSTSSFRAALQRYVVQNGEVVYADTSLRFFLRLDGLNHTGNGDFTKEVFNLQTHSDIQSLYLAYAGIPYLNHVHTRVDVNLQVDVPHQRYSFEKGAAYLNGLTLLTDGFVALPDTQNVEMDIRFHTQQSDFKHLLSLIPAIYQKNFEQLKASGTASIEGRIQGVYNYQRLPAFYLQLLVQNGMFQYPSLPDALRQVNMLVEVQNKDGILDHTTINLQRLHLEMNQQPLDAHLLITYPQTSMFIDGALHGKLDLSNISKIYPLDKQTRLKGLLDADVQLKGSLTSLQHKQYDQFQAKGYVLLNDINYQSAAFPHGLSIPIAKLLFSPAQVTLSQLQAQIGRTDIQAQGTLNQFYAYLFGKGPLEGNLNLQSRLIDLNEFMSTSPEQRPDTTSVVKAIVIPRNVNFTLTADIGRFIYSNYDVKQIQGKLSIANGTLQLQQIQSHMLGGDVILSGMYNTQDPERPETHVELSAKDLLIPHVLQTVTIAQSFLPLQQLIQGKFSGNLSLSTFLSDKWMPILSTVNSTGMLQADNLNLLEFIPLQKLATATGLDLLTKTQWPSVHFGFHIDSGYLFVHPFQLVTDSVQMTIAGKNGLNKQIDYSIQMIIPGSKLGKANTALHQLIDRANAVAGVQLQSGDKIHLNVHLTGTLLQPQLTLDLAPVTSNVQQAITTAAQKKLQEEKQKLMQHLIPSDSHHVIPHGGAASDTVSVKHEIQQTIQQTIQKRLNQFLKKKKDTTGG